MKKFNKILLTIASTAFLNVTIAQIDSVFYYNPNGTKNWWYVQQDVITFRCDNNQQYSGNFNPSLILNQEYWANDGRKMNEIHLTPSCSPMDAALMINSIRTSSEFDVFSLAVSKTVGLTCSAGEYTKSDDQLLVVFKNSVTQGQLNSFQQQYKLELIHAPDPSIANLAYWTYVFKVISRKAGSTMTSFEVAQEIFENEPTLVYSVEPNLYTESGLNCTIVDEMLLSPAGIFGSWHIRNQGTDVIYGGSAGIADADADICECWASGYTGNGIKVGLIDLAIMEFDHDDMANISKIFDCTQPSPTEVFSNLYLSAIIAHSMTTAGVIGATPNNTSLGARQAVGVAYDAEAYSYLLSTLNSADIVKALQQAFLDNVDVINMSFRLVETAAMANELSNLALLGRSHPTGTFGTVLIASTGNDDLVGDHFPANHPDVIGVGMSDPNDYRGSESNPFDNWITTGPGEGSTYGPPTYNYDVVAPGELMFLIDAMGSNGYQPGNYHGYSWGTSYSAPLVTGIAAILLEKNFELTNVQLRDALRNGADKTHPTFYDYNSYPGYPGYNDEMFYGRVSCENSLGLVPLGIQDVELIDLVIYTLTDSKYELILPEELNDSRIVIFSVSGQLIGEIDADGQSSVIIDLQENASGMYVVSLISGNTLWGMAKLVK